MPQGRLWGIVSARPDGATAVAAALAALLSAGSRTLLCDLNLERAEIAPLLDLDDSRSVYQLAYAAQLAPVTAEELEAHVSWHEGMAILPGPSEPGQADLISDHFLHSLLETATRRFDSVVLDVGRVRADVPAALSENSVLWVVAPSRLGLAAFDRTWRRLADEGAIWPAAARVVLNRVGRHSLASVPSFLDRNYGIQVLGELPDVPGFWQEVESTRSLQALSAQIPEQDRFKGAYGEEAVRLRAALQSLAQKLISSPKAAQVNV